MNVSQGFSRLVGLVLLILGAVSCAALPSGRRLPELPRPPRGWEVGTGGAMRGPGVGRERGASEEVRVRGRYPDHPLDDSVARNPVFSRPAEDVRPMPERSIRFVGGDTSLQRVADAIGPAFRVRESVWVGPVVRTEQDSLQVLYATSWYPVESAPRDVLCGMSRERGKTELRLRLSLSRESRGAFLVRGWMEIRGPQLCGALSGARDRVDAFVLDGWRVVEEGVRYDRPVPLS